MPDQHIFFNRSVTRYNAVNSETRESFSTIGLSYKGPGDPFELIFTIPGEIDPEVVAYKKMLSSKGEARYYRLSKDDQMEVDRRLLEIATAGHKAINQKPPPPIASVIKNIAT